MKLEFVVHGCVPPKKDGASSMWGKESEIAKLIALRQAASRARGANGILRRSISLHLDVYLRDPESQLDGDLDNFIAGVCDGLQAAAKYIKETDAWNRPALSEIHPSRAVAIADDSAVVAITATKRSSDAGEPWHRVQLEGEP